MQNTFFAPKIKRFIAMIISIFLLIPQAIPNVLAKAEEKSINSKFIKEVELTDWDGNPLSEVINLDTPEVMLKFKFEVSEDEAIKEGDKYYINVPKEIYMKGLDILIQDNNDRTIGTCKSIENNVIVIEFNKLIEQSTKVTGSIKIKTRFDKTVVSSSGGEKELEFKLGDVKKIIPVSFLEVKVDEPKEEIKDPIVTKTGVYNKEEDKIDWTIKIDCGDQKLSNVVLKDVLGEGQSFDDNNIILNDEKVNSGKYSINQNTLTYKFEDNITGVNTVKLSSEINDSVYINTIDDIAELSNTAEVIVGDRTPVTAQASVIVDINDHEVKKKGEYLGDDIVEWTIDLYNSCNKNKRPVIMTDNLPEGQEYVEGSLSYNDFKNDLMNVDENEVINISDDTVLKYNSGIIKFTGLYDERAQIKFKVKITDEALKEKAKEDSIENEVEFYVQGIGGDGPANNRKITGKAKIAFSSVNVSMGEKEYDPLTGEVTWKIEANDKQSYLVNPVVSNEISNNQELDLDSIIIDGQKAEVDYEDNKISFKLPTGNETHVIEYKTKVKGKDLFLNNLQNVKLESKAYLSAENAYSSNSSAEQNITPNVIEKTGSYDYSLNVVNWKVVVNSSKMLINGARIKDEIPNDQEYVEGTFKSTYVNEEDGTDLGNLEYEKLNDDSKISGVLTYNFGDENNAISDTYTITYQTKIVDESIFSNTDKTRSLVSKIFENHAKLISNDVSEGISVTGKCPITVAPIWKKCSYTTGSNIINWSILINENALELGKTEVQDNLSKYVEIDTSSIKLYKLRTKWGSLPAKDSFSQEVSIEQDQLEFNLKNKEEQSFKLKFEDLNGPYLLEYSTYIDEKALEDGVSKIGNEAFIINDKIEGYSSIKADDVFFIAGEANANLEKEKGSISITTVYEENNEPVVGADFELYDRFNNLIDTAKSDEEGKVTFKKLGFDVPYNVVQVTAPEGYAVRGGKERKYIIQKGEGKDITDTWYNKGIEGTVKVVKVGSDDLNKKLSGAKFDVFKDKNKDNIPDGSAIATLTEDIINKGEYSCDLKYGSYLLKEQVAPVGYVVNENYYPFSIIEDLKTVNVETEEGKNFVNEVIDTTARGNIQLIKVEAGSSRLMLSGARFMVYKDSNNNGAYDCFDAPVGYLKESEIGLYKMDGLECGVYFVREIRAPKGYVLDGSPRKVELTENGQTVNVTSYNYGLYFYNRPILGVLRATPLDVFTEEARNDKSKLYVYKDEDGDNYPDGDAIVVVDKNMFGEYVTELRYGEYVLREEKTVHNYEEIEEYYHFSITRDNQIENVMLS